ncbi:LacI family DNA-binding transcriptional regulator [Asinibacterium sp. OR53]|uniref:LacI family DNA-binding transcriptional regulator n=1 Tax=Asinibacterium sp. OR53 TaxID=925409 RepID=UPI0004BADC09|nr:LacI family DNA-binding transcriptional regulator [Asinibacterium sp. OR53]
MKKNTSLKDIARHLGVSVALVSYVLNGKAEENRIGEEIAQKVRKAAEELNYQPNYLAKSLRASKTHTIGLVVADIKYHFTAGITRSIEAAAKKEGYTVILGNSHEDHREFEELITVFMNRKVDGLILIAVERSEPQIKRLLKDKIPFVLIDRVFPGIPTTNILLDNYLVAYQCVEYAIKRGYKRIGFVNFKTTLFHRLERNRGYAAALQAYRLPMNTKWEKAIREERLAQDTANAVKELITQTPACDAIVFASDILAVTGLKVMNQLKIAVPRDVAVVSFDEAEAFDLFSCSITHAKQPVEEIGKIAVTTLIEKMAGKKVPSEIKLKSSFIVGGSCGE